MSVKSVALICLGALINIGGFYLSDKLMLPIWLDSVGTCLSAAALAHDTYPASARKGEGEVFYNGLAVI